MNNFLEKIIWSGSQRAAIFLRKSHQQSIFQIQKYAQIGKISSGLIHDLTSPITSLNLQMEMIDETIIKDPNFLLHIKDAVVSVNEYSKIIKEYISGQSKKQLIDLSLEIEKALKLISYKAIKKNIQIQFIRKNNPKIFIDKVLVYQIIISLVSNAIESFRESDSNRKIIIHMNEDNYINISITDFGCGIKNIHKIFQTFYTTKQNDGGTGIGLSNVKYIIEKELSGKINVKSKLNEGSTFEILIPKN